MRRGTKWTIDYIFKPYEIKDPLLYDVKGGCNMKKIILTLIMALLIFSICTAAFALPNPYTAHYPKAGMLTLSPSKKTNNTFAFKASRWTDTRVQLHISGAYTDACKTEISIQMFVINKWGNWIAFGNPQLITLNCFPLTQNLYFPIRERRQFCIVVSVLGVESSCVIPYQITTI
jgi:hypothetical protein